MTRSEALSVGLSECQLRGYTCTVKEIHRTGNGIWKVKFAANRGAQRGHLHLDLDGWTGDVLKVKDKMKAKGRDKDKDHDDDDDDDRGRRRGHKKK